MINTYPISDAYIARHNVLLYALKIQKQQNFIARWCKCFPYLSDSLNADLREYCAELAQNQDNLRYWQGKLHESSITPFMVIVSRACKGCGIEIVDSRVYCNECLIEENV
jgi:hypothetical protein